MTDSVKSLTSVEINKIHCSPVTCQAGLFVVEWKFGQAWFPLHKSKLTGVPFLSFECSFQGLFTQSVDEADKPVLLQVLHHPWRQEERLFSSGGQEPVPVMTFQKLLSGIAVSAASSLSTCRYILSSPVDVCMSILFKCSLSWCSSTEGKSSLPSLWPQQHVVAEF